MAKNCKEVNMINFEDIRRVRTMLEVGDQVMIVTGGKDGRQGKKYPVIGKNRHIFMIKCGGSVECFGYTELLAEQGDVRIVI